MLSIMHSVPFIVSPSTAALSYRKPSTDGSSRESSRAQINDERNIPYFKWAELQQSVATTNKLNTQNRNSKAKFKIKLVIFTGNAEMPVKIAVFRHMTHDLVSR
jgi:hypothetical protein